MKYIPDTRTLSTLAEQTVVPDYEPTPAF